MLAALQSTHVPYRLHRPCMASAAGASGGVIEKSVADELGLVGFGELYVAGMSGTVRSHGSLLSC